MEWIENVDHDQQQHGMLVTGSEGEISGWNWGDVAAAIQAKRSQEHKVQSTEGIVHIEPAFTFSDFPIDIGTGRKIETNALFYDRHVCHFIRVITWNSCSIACIIIRGKRVLNCPSW